MLHATNRTSLHECISVLDVRRVFTTNESAGKVCIISEDVWMVLAPLEVNIEQKHFLLVDVGKLSRLLPDIWLSIVVNEDIIGIELSIWIHNAYRKWIEIDAFITILKFFSVSYTHLPLPTSELV